MVQPGWFDRQTKSISDEVREWPEKLKMAAGIDGPTQVSEFRAAGEERHDAPRQSPPNSDGGS
jgi:hypothetical protein